MSTRILTVVLVISVVPFAVNGHVKAAASSTGAGPVGEDRLPGNVHQLLHSEQKKEPAMVGSGVKGTPTVKPDAVIPLGDEELKDF